MRVLWISNETPDVHGQGGQRRQHFLVRALARRGHDVTAVTLDGPQDGGSLGALAEVVRVSTRIRGRIPDPRFWVAVEQLRRRGWDRVVVSHSQSWPVFRRLARSTGAPILVDLHNVLGAGTDPSSSEWRGVEAEVARVADEVTVCSSAERDTFERLYARRAVVVPHGIDATEWHRDPGGGPEPVVKLFGNWGWGPNRAGLEWFVTRVWPRVHESTGVGCEVAGLDAGRVADGVRGLRTRGRVPSVAEFLVDASAVCVPVVNGLGAPVKFLEAVASGAPVLATTRGASRDANLAILTSDAPDVWVAALERILRDGGPERARAREARRWVLAHGTWDAAAAPLVQWVESREVGADEGGHVARPEREGRE